MLADLRAVFGLTQQRLASWLGLSRAALSMAEAGQRGLPQASRLRRIRLDLAQSGLVPGAGGVALPPQPAPPVYPEPLVRRLADCRYHAQRLRFELQDLRARAAQYEARLAALPALRAWTGPVANPAHDANWLSLFEGEAVDGLQLACGAGPQRLLEIRIAGLEREAELLDEALRELPETAPF
ncbi:hypothetical protein [Hymenobacter sp. B81]|uniref:hypothetical protein n=1 Tax=Hymenobacter sp. B81 TaxID=3344878 RepID=UPI0037DDB751